MFAGGEGMGSSPGLGTDFMDMSRLTDLMREAEGAAQKREGETVPPVAIAPTSIVTSSSKKVSIASEGLESRSEEEDPLAIWSAAEIPNEEDLIDKYDKRPAPKYEFFFKSLVGSEDVFLGLHDKSPSVQDCSHLVVKVRSG